MPTSRSVFVWYIRTSSVALLQINRCRSFPGDVWLANWKSTNRMPLTCSLSMILFIRKSPCVSTLSPVSLLRVSVLIRSQIFSCNSRNFVTYSRQGSGHVCRSATRVFTIPRSTFHTYVSSNNLNTEIRLNIHIHSVSFIVSPSKAAVGQFVEALNYMP